jgi:hypothetical protein
VTKAEHIAEAERWLALRTDSPNARDFASPQQCIEIAQVHATLALAIASTKASG